MKILYDELHLMKVELLQELEIINRIIERLCPKDNSTITHKPYKNKRAKRGSIKRKVLGILSKSKKSLYPREILNRGNFTTSISACLSRLTKSGEITKTEGRYKIA